MADAETITLAIFSAMWLGILTSISPCPLATNIAAVSFIGRSVHSHRRTLLAGLLYALGRTVVYVAIGATIMLALGSSEGSSGVIAKISASLQKYMPLILGPLLTIVGMMLLGLLNFSGSINVHAEKLQKKLAAGHAFWAFPMGVLFALSFCPISAGIFFVSLLGLSRIWNSPFLLPAIYGLGTALPVIVFAFIIAFASQYVGKLFNRLTQIEKIVRFITGLAILLIGLFFIARDIFQISALQ